LVSRYKILLSESAVKDLRAIPPRDAQRVVKKLKDFGETSRGDIKNLRVDLWRLRVGDYRVFFHWKGEEIRVLRIIPRRIAYRLDLIQSLLKHIRTYPNPW
jgi:mRNA-degrading endonuclease RelE of RelBE toxin-antitoxin system